MKRLYLAAPLFSESERAYNFRFASLLGEFFDIFLPQRDGYLMADLVKNGFSSEESSKYVFNRDIEAIKNSQVVLAVLDGRTIDEGVAFELGFALAIGLRCFGLQTDVRRQLVTGNNPMIQESLIRIFSSVQGALDWAVTESGSQVLSRRALPQAIHDSSDKKGEALPVMK